MAGEKVLALLIRSEVIVAFPLQRRLRERATVLWYTYIAYLVWVSQGAILQHYEECDTTVNNACSCETWREKLKPAVQSKQNDGERYFIVA
jgi:hypothetical protein